MKRWTKAEIKQARFALEWAAHSNRPIVGAFGARPGEREAADAAFREWLAPRRAAIVVAHLRGLESLMRDRAQSDRETVEHARTHPNVWGKATDEIVERFSKLGRESAAAAEKLATFAERIEAEGLPPEVEAYDPTEPKP